jgi:hypothetical protein
VSANVRAGLWTPSPDDLEALGSVNAGRAVGMTHAAFTRR